LKILWFNWRDIANPDAGGAEVLTHEVSKRLVNKGHRVTLFSATFANSCTTENIDGIDIVRDGGKYAVYSKARNYYKKNKNSYDVVIDEINVRPFLTPKFVKEKPLLALIHQISPEQFLLELPFPLSYLGRYFLEKKWLSDYRDILTVTVSNSTKRDLENLGFKRVLIIPEGLSITPLSAVPQKESNPTIVFIGRLKRHKLPDHALRAFSLIKRQMPKAQLWIIGDGYMRKELEEKFNTKDSTFYGRVSSELKYHLLSRAHVVIVPAIREGWGLVVTEANSVGTPAVGYDVPGLRDSIKNGETGIIVKENCPTSLAFSVVSLLRNNSLLATLSSNALSFSKQFSWDICADVFEEMIVKEATRKENSYFPQHSDELQKY
jgi:glycosyltransferase involved in cell wall biosynthesis